MDAGRGAGLGQEALARARVGVDVVEELDRDRAVEHQVVAEEDHAHVAAPDHADQPVLVELFGQRPGRGRHRLQRSGRAYTAGRRRRSGKARVAPLRHRGSGG
jgi:hypothetical protein